jgi:MoxR-like ATPase
MSALIKKIIDQLDQVLLGKDQQVRLALACLFAEGHLLIEDLPGMGKTTLAQGLAKVLGLKFERVQFTSDLLPADILGVAIFEREQSQFRFHAGPIFTQVLLADEINRSSPKTQSALLEAMEEGQVTVEGKSRPLPHPFFVIATQNPLSQSGTFPLPESQLDRFLMRISLGYPSQSSERLLFEGADPRARIREFDPVITLEELITLQTTAKQVTASGALLDYVQRLVAFTRNDALFTQGLSTRGALSLLRAAKAWAIIQGRDYLVPEDVQAIVPSVVGHRVKGSGHSQDGQQLVKHLIDNVNVLE